MLNILNFQLLKKGGGLRIRSKCPSKEGIPEKRRVGPSGRQKGKGIAHARASNQQDCS